MLYMHIYMELLEWIDHKKYDNNNNNDDAQQSSLSNKV